MKSFTRLYRRFLKLPEHVRVGICAGLAAFFFTHGLPLWDDDYTQWLAQARESLPSILLRILSPFTSEPQTWGYSDRPVQVLLYKLMHLFFDFWGTGFHLLKAAAFGALAATLHLALRPRTAKEGLFGRALDRRASFAAIALLSLSVSTVASLVWLSDFTVLSQLAAATLLFYAHREIQAGPGRLQSVFGKGLGGIPRSYLRLSLVLIAGVYFGAKLRGDLRLVPVILGLHLAFYDRARLKAYLAPLAISLFASLPYSDALFQQRPPFLPGAQGYAGWTYAPFSLGRVREFLFRDFLALNFTTTPLSVLAAAGTLLVIGAGLVLVYRLSRSELKAPDSRVGFALTWFAVALVACGTLSPQNPTFETRYGLTPLVPAVLLMAAFLDAVVRDFGRLRFFRYVFPALLCLQLGLHFTHSYFHRRNVGRVVVAIDRAYGKIEGELASAPAMALLPGFLPYGYRQSASAPALNGRRPLASLEEVARLAPGSVVLGWAPELDARLVLHGMASGCSTSLFDLLAPCGPADGAAVLRVVASPPELAQADSLDRQGAPGKARDALDAYLSREPGNLGAWFLHGVYSYKLRDFVRMDESYTRLGPYFPATARVLYNWGLAKQGRGDFGEAARLFERAYALAPGDYGVGYNLADAYHRQGKKSRALATLDELMRVYPGDATIRSAREQWSK